MSFNIIDLSGWKRKSYYEHYMNKVRCTYSVTINIKIGALLKKIKSLSIKTYPVQVYMISQAVNSFSEFRMAVNQEGKLGYWHETSPCYTIFNKTSETFSSIFTPYNQVFTRFYADCKKDIETHSTSEALFPQGNPPENVFFISALPWLSFTAFNLNVYAESTYLIPIFTIGRHLEQNGATYMPLSIQAHHAVCDGYHVGKFVEALQDIANSHNNWL